jgi:hypothetical protein
VGVVDDHRQTADGGRLAEHAALIIMAREMRLKSITGEPGSGEERKKEKKRKRRGSEAEKRERRKREEGRKKSSGFGKYLNNRCPGWHVCCTIFSGNYEKRDTSPSLSGVPADPRLPGACDPSPSLSDQGDDALYRLSETSSQTTGVQVVGTFKVVRPRR